MKASHCLAAGPGDQGSGVREGRVSWPSGRFGYRGQNAASPQGTLETRPRSQSMASVVPCGAGVLRGQAVVPAALGFAQEVSCFPSDKRLPERSGALIVGEKRPIDLAPAAETKEAVNHPLLLDHLDLHTSRS